MGPVWLFWPLLAFIISCSPARFVQTLDKGEHAANLSLGGPLIGFAGATIPIPFVTATYGYGLDSATTLFAAFNLTSALYQNFQIEAGATRRLLKPNRWQPGISLTPSMQLIYHDRQARKLYPILDINLYWNYGKRKHYWYAGLNNWFELSGQRVHGQSQTRHWTLSPQLGHVFNMKRRWEWITEFKVIAPGRSNQQLVVDYKTPLGTHGALGIYMGLSKRF